MGKISDHHEQMERDRKTTVAEYAQELRKSVDVFMVQLKEAGIKKTSENDDLTDADKQKLLQFLQKSHGTGKRRKKITLNNESFSDRLLKSITKEENGAERACLEYFAGIVIAGVRVDSKLQEVVNLIIAKTLIFDALPMRKLGRPKLEKSDDKGKEVAEEYWVLRDGGSSYNDAVRHLSEKIHKNERQVMRLVAKHKDSVGLTFEEREKNRHRLVQLYLIPPLSSEPVFLKSLEDMYTLPPAPEFTVDDYIEFLDEKIMKLIQQDAPTVTKD